MVSAALCPSGRDGVASVESRSGRKSSPRVFPGGCPACGAERNKGREWVRKPYKCECSPERRAFFSPSPTDAEAADWNSRELR